MQPKTKLQKEVFTLSEALPKISETQKMWTIAKCLKHVGYRNKSGISCMDCGHRFVGYQTVKSCACPQCGVKLIIEDTRHRLFTQDTLLGVLDVSGGFQVIRFFEVKSYHKANEKASYCFREVIQHWINENGKFELVARNRAITYYSNGFSGAMEIRNKNGLQRKYDLIPNYVCPKPKLLPIIKRNGFANDFKDLTPFEMFTGLISDSKTETLLKANQNELLSCRYNGRKSKIDKHWKSIKICIRANYSVTDAVSWLDYLDLLSFFGKDLTNKKYVCPTDLKAEHDKYVAKKSEHDKKVAFEKQKQSIVEDQALYEESKSKYFGVVIVSENITIKVLESVKEFLEEGLVHGHCVFTNEYHKKEDSLILSAQVDGKPMETIELSLSKLKIVQSRGLGNRPTEYHDKIVELVQSNLKQIKQKRKLKAVA